MDEQDKAMNDVMGMEAKAPHDGRCILVCAGDFTPVDLARGEDDIIIAADNGLTYLNQMGILPDYCIGDYDSLAPETEVALEEIYRLDRSRVITLPKEKDDTDTMAAARLGLQLGYRRFDIYGALGGERFSHTMANIQTLLFLKSEGALGYIMDTNQMIFVLRNETKSFHPGFSGRFSMFALEPVIRGVTIKGMKYELEDAELTYSFPIGCSNEISDRAASVTVKEGTALIVVGWE